MPKKMESKKPAKKETLVEKVAVGKSVRSKKTVIKKEPENKAQIKPKSRNAVEVYNLQGKIVETISLPKEIFDQKPNLALISQALRVYESILHPHNVAAKTRSNVRGGGAKPWRQKGTGRARAGSSRSPLWVGGGVSLGPVPGKRKLTLPKKMKRKALISALSLKKSQNQIKIVSGIDKIEPKTKTAKVLFQNMEIKGPSLFISEGKNNNLKLALRNINGVSIENVENLNAYKVLSVKNLLFTKESLVKLS